MVGESLAIIAVILVMAAMLAKAGRSLFAAITLPLISIPVLHLAGLAFQMQGGLLVMDWIGLAVGAILCFLFSGVFRSKRSKTCYLAFCLVFLAALLVAYLLRQ